MPGRGVSVGVMEGGAGDDVTVNVGVTVAVGLGLAVREGGREVKVIWVAAGAQAPSERRTVQRNKDRFFIVHLCQRWLPVMNC